MVFIKYIFKIFGGEVKKKKNKKSHVLLMTHTKDHCCFVCISPEGGLESVVLSRMPIVELPEPTNV